MTILDSLVELESYTIIVFKKQSEVWQISPFEFIKKRKSYGFRTAKESNCNTLKI